jgi:phosphoadenosine phosphosulfate reductase
MRARTTEELKTVAEAAQVALASASAEEALEWTARTFGDSWIVASSMQDAVLIDLAATVRPDVEVLFLETGYHFPETIGTRNEVGVVYPRARIHDVRAERTVPEQDAVEGPRLYERDPDLCCFLRKVLPLRQKLAGYEAWVTGVRRVDSANRRDTPVVVWDDANGLVKVNPIAAWTDEQLYRYVDERDVPVNMLVAEGYPSIGCAPCTSKPLPGNDARSGRWAGRAKTECGLHRVDVPAAKTPYEPTLET